MPDRPGFAVPVSHMSGAVSHLGIALDTLDFNDFLLTISIVAGFFAGAFVSGLVLRDTLFKVRRRYGVLLLVECGLLIAAMLLALKGEHCRADGGHGVWLAECDGE